MCLLERSANRRSAADTVIPQAYVMVERRAASPSGECGRNRTVLNCAIVILDND